MRPGLWLVLCLLLLAGDRGVAAVPADHEFDAGSRVAIDALTPIQVENLALLGKVWGFLKYHHPRVAAGGRRWDGDLFRVMPEVLAAPDAAAGRRVLSRWVAGLGAIRPCDPCATLDETDLALAPDHRWIDDQRRVGPALGAQLRSALAARPRADAQHYVAPVPGARNPQFLDEPDYASMGDPDAGYRLLALYRFWNIIAYWFPYRDAMAEDWDAVLARSIPRFALARDRAAYHRELLALVALVHDTHANAWSAVDDRPPTGDADVPVLVRFVGELPVVAGLPGDPPATSTGLAAGDVITRVDGEPVADMISRLSPYHGASTRAALLRDIAREMLRGPRGTPARLGVLRAGRPLQIVTPRTAPLATGRAAHSLPGAAFRWLTPDVAYLSLHALKVADVDRDMQEAARAHGLIIDIRNYPAEFVLFALGGHLVDRPTPFARFTVCDLENPGACHWSEPVVLTPRPPRFGGKVAILVDETTQSQAEYTTMALRAAPGAVVIGSTTSGADGNVSTIPLPGGQSARISGLGVFYPDRRPTQRVGIIPDVVITPTVEGLRAGRDEVLEEAQRRVSR